MFRKGDRVRFKQDKFDVERTKRIGGDPRANPPTLPDLSITRLVPGPDETFTVQAVIPWHRKGNGGGEADRVPVLDENAWVDLGPGHRHVAMKILEKA